MEFASFHQIPFREAPWLKWNGFARKFGAPPAAEYWRRMADSGWRLSAVEWTRESSERRAAPSVAAEEIPYGVQIADDCVHLEPNPAEHETLMFMLELIVQDRGLLQSRGRAESARLSHPARHQWTAPAVFNLLPRMIEVGPHVFSQIGMGGPPQTPVPRGLMV